jgi:hypothetical protein
MKFRLLFVCSLLHILINIYAQEDDKDYNNRPFQVTFITPLGTNGTGSPRIINKLSFNILAGYNGGVDGFELGGFLNLSDDYVKGVQIAGFGNIVGGDIEAAQIAGFMNIDGGEVNGVQTSGFMNIVGGEVSGLQTSGFINIAGGNAEAVQIGGFANLSDALEGVQVSGFGNIAEETNGVQVAGFGNLAEESEGVQVAGFMNISDDINGVQVAGFLNAASDIEGIQTAGFLNIARNVKGVQIAGFINICDTINGIALAPISIVKKGGYRRFEFWADETFFLNTSFKIGVKHFYTVYTLGFKPVNADFNTGIGFGVGTNIALTSDNSIDLEAHTYIVNRYFWEKWYYNSLNQLRVSFNYQLSEHFSIFAGPTFNILVADINTYADEIAPPWAFRIADRKDSIRGWFGFNIGMRF